jgi:hypothetical protein
MVVVVSVVITLLGDGGSANADFTFGEPTILELPVNSAGWYEGSTVPADGLSLFFGSLLTEMGDWDLYMATRETTDDPWSAGVNLGPTVNTPQNEAYPSISADGLLLYFSSDRPGGSGDCDLWVTTRKTTNNDWGTPANLGLTVNSPSFDARPSISCDNRVLFFQSDRRRGFGSTDLWMTRWSTISGTWGQPVNLGALVNSPYDEGGVSISADACGIYFHSNRPGGYGGWDLYYVPITPIVDFNGDGVVDLVDLVMLIDNWGTDDTLYDIGPKPWGDGMVEVGDLKAFITHWEKENAAVQP